VITKIHTYAGLLTFVNLMVYGIVGIAAAFEPPPGAPGPAAEVREAAFTMEPNLTDREVADKAARQLGLWLALPVQNFAIQHDNAGRLVLNFQHANGRDRVTFPEGSGRLRLEHTRNPLLGGYLAGLHTASAAFHVWDWRMQLWGYYNEFAMWCLMLMTGTGVYMWLSKRARHRWALASFLSGTGLFLAMYWWTR
jgi:hypothetical protein